jgi:hypothetical protein
MYYMLVACMARPLNTGQDIATYLLLHLIPIVLHHLIHLVLPKDPMSFRIFLVKTIAETSAWRLRGHPRNARPKRFKCFKKPKMKMVSKAIQDKTIAKKAPLLPRTDTIHRLQGWLSHQKQTPPFSSPHPEGSTVPGTLKCLTWQSHGPI